MYILRRLVFFAFLGGIYLVIAGGYDMFIQATARGKPEMISISEPETNVPFNRHLIITGGEAMVSKAVEYYQTRRGVRVANSETYFIPISGLPGIFSTFFLNRKPARHNSRRSITSCSVSRLLFRRFARLLALEAGESPLKEGVSRAIEITGSSIWILQSPCNRNFFASVEPRTDFIAFGPIQGATAHPAS